MANTCGTALLMPSAVREGALVMGPARAAIVLASLAFVGISTMATPASGAESVRVRITTAPSSAGIAGDFKYVDLLATNESSTAVGPLDWSVTFDANTSLSVGDLYVEGFVGGDWKPLTEHVDGDDLRVELGTPSAIDAFRSFRGQVRFLLVDGAGRGPGTFMSSVSIEAGVHPAGSPSLVASDTTEAAVHLLEVGAPAGLTVTVGTPEVFDVTTHNGTGSNFASVAIVPSRATGLRIEWERDGTFVDLDGVDDLPELALHEGASTHTRWRLTYTDRFDAAGAVAPIVWTAVRVGYDLDAGQRAASAAPDPDGRYFAGQATTRISLTGGATPAATATPPVPGTTATPSTSTASSQGDGNVSVTVPGPGDGAGDDGDDGDDGDNAPAGSLARTGVDLVLRLVVALLLTAIGIVLVSGTRPRRVGRHR